MAGFGDGSRGFLAGDFSLADGFAGGSDSLLEFFEQILRVFDAGFGEAEVADEQGAEGGGDGCEEFGAAVGEVGVVEDEEVGEGDVGEGEEDGVVRFGGVGLEGSGYEEDGFGGRSLEGFFFGGDGFEADAFLFAPPVVEPGFDGGEGVERAD